jgi:hypothetical protein
MVKRMNRARSKLKDGWIISLVSANASGRFMRRSSSCVKHSAGEDEPAGIITEAELMEAVILIGIQGSGKFERGAAVGCT